MVHIYLFLGVTDFDFFTNNLHLYINNNNNHNNDNNNDDVDDDDGTLRKCQLEDA